MLRPLLGLLKCQQRTSRKNRYWVMWGQCSVEIIYIPVKPIHPMGPFIPRGHTFNELSKLTYQTSENKLNSPKSPQGLIFGFLFSHLIEYDMNLVIVLSDQRYCIFLFTPDQSHSIYKIGLRLT